VGLALRRLDFFHRDAVGVGVSSLPDSRHLPGNFHSRLVGPDRELMIADFFRHDGLRELADHGELVAEIAVERLEPITLLWDASDTALAFLDNFRIANDAGVDG